MAAWSWITVKSVPLLVIVPAIPALGIFIAASIMRWTLFNQKLRRSGQRTRAQIVYKFEKGSRTYYKVDKGKIYFLVTEFVVFSNKTNRYMLCQSRFMVDVHVFNQYEAGQFLNLIYVPSNYKRLLIVVTVPLAIAIFAKSWSMFALLMIIGVLYYGIVYFLFRCCCPNHDCFKNKSFKQRKARKGIDSERFGIEIKDETDKNKETVKAKLLSGSVHVHNSKYQSCIDSAS